MTNVNDLKQISVRTRLGAMLLDHLFMTIIALVFFLPGMISGFSDAFTISHEQTNPDFMDGTLGYIGMFGFSLYFCKDICNGRSIAKRILKLQMIDNATGEVASPMKCFVRNIFCIIWPIEVIVAMTNTNRRIGDKIAGTKLVPFNPSLKQPKINIGKIFFPIGISYALVLLSIQLIPKIEMSKINYSETSYNHTESKELEKLLTDSLRQYLSPDIKIYDSIKNESLKYASIILKLKENYIQDNNSYIQLNEKITNLIYSKFPKETFTGQLKYIYKTPGYFQGRTIQIGTYLKQKDDK